MIKACILIVIKQLRSLCHLKKIPDTLKIHDNKLNPTDRQAFHSKTHTGMHWKLYYYTFIELKE